MKQFTFTNTDRKEIHRSSILMDLRGPAAVAVVTVIIWSSRADDFAFGSNDAFFAAQNAASALVYASAASSASRQYVGESNGRGVWEERGSGYAEFLLISAGGGEKIWVWCACPEGRSWRWTRGRWCRVRGVGIRFPAVSIRQLRSSSYFIMSKAFNQAKLQYHICHRKIFLEHWITHPSLNRPGKLFRCRRSNLGRSNLP
jgi:hypothetical protein